MPWPCGLEVEEELVRYSMSISCWSDWYMKFPGELVRLMGVFEHGYMRARRAMTCSGNSAENCVGADTSVLHVNIGGHLGGANGCAAVWLLSTRNFEVQVSARDSNIGWLENVIIWCATTLVINCVVAC